jgi:hypothetical protein
MANYPNYNLYGKRPADTYRNIVQFNITASNLVDSFGDDLPLTMSIEGTSSWANNAINAVSASWAPDQTVTVNSASWASQSLSASWAPGGVSGTTLVTASTYQITASVANNAVSASWAPSSAQVEQVSASWASQSLSSSHVLGNAVYGPVTDAVNATSSSYAESASWAPFTDTGTTLVTASTYQITASSAVSASWAPFTSQVEQVSASWASQSLSASWAPGDGSGTLLTTGSTYEITSSWSNKSVSASYAPFTQTEQVSASWASASISASWAPVSITYPLTVLASNLETSSIDFLAGQYFQLDTTASVFTFDNSTNVTAVRNASIYITPQSGSRTIVFHPSWIVMGNFPTTIAHNSASVLSLTTFGSNDASVVAAFASKV